MTLALSCTTLVSCLTAGSAARAIDSERGRAIYSQRIATVEPVFANIRHTKRLDRFTLRGKEKVGTQWRLYCLVHNIEKLARKTAGGDRS